MAVTVRGPFISEESLTVAGTSVALAAVPGGGQSAFITVETAAIRFWLSSTAPTATVGHVAEPGDTVPLHSTHELQNFRAIRRDGISATLRVSYSEKSIN